jgi:hypothetical protein
MMAGAMPCRRKPFHDPNAYAPAAGDRRWEDYTQSAMDPDDDCTIWYSGDYPKKDAAAYSSAIGAFQLPGCDARR